MSGLKRIANPVLTTTLLLMVAFCGGLGCKGKAAKSSKQHLDFNQDVQPILASNCFSCHGPDPGNRKAGLRLDLEEWALRKRPGKPDAIVPGHPELSELVKRIEEKNPHQLMPQSSQGEAKPMKPEEIAVLKEWIREGAQYRPHWAFENPMQVAPPPANDKGWVKTPIDSFVFARLKKQGLHPSPDEEKTTLIRRVSLDLTGLLPTPVEVKAFVDDNSPDAYESLVDRLLARPAYGEQRARYWLDYARYGDSYGLHNDYNRNAWPYRDYLIRAFNSNKPFDQFVREQIAGDMLQAKNLDPWIASGYVRSGVSSNEGGTIPEELRANIARERTEAYGAAFLGLTVGCAVCHDHKYDPTTQKDFYALSAFFNNIDELPFNGDQPNWAPVVRIPKSDKVEPYNRVLERRSKLAAELAGARENEQSLVKAWVESHQHPARAVSAEKMELHLKLDEGSGDVVKNSSPNANPSSFSLGKATPQWGETTWLWPDFRMDTGTRVMLGQAGNFDGNQAFSGGGWFMVRAAPLFLGSKGEGALIAKMDATQHNVGWDLAVEKGTVSVELNGITAGNSIRVITVKPLPTDNHWRHIFFTYDGSGTAGGIRIYINGEPVVAKVTSDTLGRVSIRTHAPLQLGWRYPDAAPARDTRYQDIRLYGRALTGEEARRLLYEDYASEIITKPMGEWNRDQWHAVSEFYLLYVNDRTKTLSGEIAKLDAELEKLSAGGDMTLVAREKPSVAYANVLARGVFSARGERVEADTPHFLPPLPAGQPHNRLALADWTVSEKNPLTARVTVNRMWNELFGAGLVETTEDFGIMGQRPSNPELLDWLAVEFRRSGWNVKHMYKLMVMSETYRQSSKSTPEQLAIDPKNLLLAHGPRFRMDAEMLRDIALQSSELLVEKIGGPSVRPYQPPNVWEAVGNPTSDTTHYKQQHGETLYRRSMYTYWKRMAIMPDMDAFDAPARDTACTRRQRTDTPLQALVTMNDTQWIEAARALAQRLIKEGGKDPDQRIRYLSEVLLAHDPSPKMEASLRNSLDHMNTYYAANPKAAHLLVTRGESRADPGIPVTELAAWTMVASEVLNLDDTLTK